MGLVEGDKMLAVRDDGDLVLMSCMLRESVWFGRLLNERDTSSGWSTGDGHAPRCRGTGEAG